MSDSREFKRTCGFRFFPTDAVVIVLGVIGTIVLWRYLLRYALIIGFVVANFFLFCNVFRVRRSYELTWSTIFIVNCILWWLFGDGNVIGMILFQIPVTGIAITLEIFSPRYHGIFAKKWNAGHIHDYLSGKTE